MKNKLRDRFNAGEKTIGTFTHLKSMEAIEAIGAAGMTFLVIDTEHCPVSVTETAKYIQAADGVGLDSLVRVSDITRPAILQPLDAGAKGVIVPCIKTVEQAKQLVEYAKFKPVGQRGYCMSRDGIWGDDKSYADGLAGYMKEANDKTLLILQCETVECAKQIDDIVGIDGVDGIMVGPNDLSIAMGIPGQFKNPEFIDTVQSIVDACKKAGKMSFAFCHDAKEANERFAQGFDNAIVGIDILTLISSYKKILEEVKGV